MSYYTHPAQSWSKEQASKAVRRVARDGLGTAYPFKGAQPEVKGAGFYSTGLPINTGKIRYNGGKTIEGDWYEGEIFQLPHLPKGFAWVYVPSWCWRIVEVAKGGAW